MKVYTNEVLIEKRKKLAGIITPIAMFSLIGGLVTNFMSARGESPNSTFIFITISLLIIGFVTATISAHLVNHWVKEPRVDQVLARALKGFDNQHVLFNHTAKVPHILLSPDAIYAITPKIVNGVVSVNNRKWRRAFKFTRLLKFFGEEGLGNPTVEAETNQAKLERLIETHLSDGENIPVESLIVFTDPTVELTVTDPVIPVITSNRLKKYLRQTKQKGAISHEQRQQLVEIFNPEVRSKE